MDLPTKITLTTLPAVALGAILGTTVSARRSSLVFRAENAHRVPHTTRGWYFYHKSKNYASMLGGVKGGVRAGATVGGWVAGLVVVKEVVGEVVGGLGGSVVAGLSVAGAFSVLNGFSYGMAVMTAKRGLGFGILFGVGQELVEFVGRRDKGVS